MESWCLQVGKILNTSSVTELQVRDCFLSARCWLNLASGLRGNPDSKLQWLELYDAWWKDTSAGKYVADMINRAPLLETLRLGGYYGNMEDETVGILSQVLIQSSSLRELAVDQVKWGPALLKALAGDDGNRSIECLRLRSACMPHSDFVSWTRGLGDCLGKLLTCKPFWKEMELHFLEMSPEEWHQLGEVIRDNATATTILVAFNLVDGDQWKSIEALAFSAMSDVKDPTVELHLYTFSDRVNDMRGNHLTRLDLCDTERDEEAFRDLMGVLQVNLGLREIDVSRTSWARDGKAAQIQETLKQNEKRAVYMSVFREANLTFGDAKVGRLFLCGSPRPDPNWLTNTFFDELIALDQNFQAQESEYSKRASTYTSKDGFVSESVFARLIEEFVRKQPHQQRGCPGVALVLGVIQTFCVEMLIPSHLRGAILIEKLKSNFIRSINDKLEEMSLERSHLMEKEELFHYEHCWPPIERHIGGIFERARDLLCESDVEALVDEIRQKRIVELKSLQEGIISVDNDLAQCYPEAENMVSYSNLPPMKDPKPLTFRCLSRASTSVKNPSVETQLVLSKMHKLIQMVHGLNERLRSVQSILERLAMKMGQIFSLHQDFAVNAKCIHV
ncbi:hypothetical protein AXG93_2817s1140 [Marchantia polymorpha subsp. ruderalis]|uniref:Uncharacterized protein n=1 Tax=Marchantia polymorpha subsp. ruderalis TaxID=1480154 RepID=A0A176W2Q1_MARPO|nr:hypothetical protein AXG93_2817s1140 [Marchantia polymorpha subsp. ruderalis]